MWRWFNIKIHSVAKLSPEHVKTQATKVSFLYISNQLNGKTLHNGQLPACNVQTYGEPITKNLIYILLVMLMESHYAKEC